MKAANTSFAILALFASGTVSTPNNGWKQGAPLASSAAIWRVSHLTRAEVEPYAARYGRDRAPNPIRDDASNSLYLRCNEETAGLRRVNAPREAWWWSGKGMEEWLWCYMTKEEAHKRRREKVAKTTAGLEKENELFDIDFDDFIQIPGADADGAGSSP